MNRREFIRNTSLVASTAMLGSVAGGAESDFPVVRIPEAKRRFKSAAVERTIEQVKVVHRQQGIGVDVRELLSRTPWTRRWIFPCSTGGPDTYVITGDIDAMWLRDSSAQVWPYLPLTKEDESLRQLIAGVINRQTRCVLLDPYANAFYKDETKISDWKSDLTDMKPGVHERKWEIDSLCYTIRLALRLLENHRRHLAFRRPVAGSRPEDSADLSRAATQARPRAVSFPAQHLHAHGQFAGTRLRQSRQAGRLDFLHVPPE